MDRNQKPRRNIEDIRSRYRGAGPVKPQHARPAQVPTPKPIKELPKPLAIEKKPMGKINLNEPSLVNRPLPAYLNDSDSDKKSSILPVKTKRKDRKEKKEKKKWSKKKKIVKTFLSILLIIGVVVAVFGASLLSKLDKVLHGNLFSDASAFLNTQPLKGESSGRVNILLAGNSADDVGHNGADLTDSIMVISIDTTTHNAFMLSIPRDLWVDIPTLGHQKINDAITVSDFSAPGYPSNGMGQLEQIIQTQLGIPLDYYVLIDYAALRDAANAVGGIPVNIQSSDPRGLYDPSEDFVTKGPLVKLSNGWHTLNGEQALDLARARGDAYGSYGYELSDFERTQNQRLMLVSLAQKAKSTGVVTNPLKISALFSAFSNNVHTDMTLNNVLRLAQVTKPIDLNSIQSQSFSYAGANPLLKGYVDPGSGQDALIPTSGLDNFTALTQYYQQLTSTNPVVREGANVVILNGSDKTGIASTQGDKLTAAGYNITAVASAGSKYSGTMIVDMSNGKKPASLAGLKGYFPGSVVQPSDKSMQAKEAQNYPNADFVVILGQNWNSASSN